MTPDQKAQFTICKDFIKTARMRIQEFEMQQSSLYDQTAENRARNRTILWWVLQMAHSEDNDENKAFFGEGSYEDKLAIYDTMEEEDDDFILGVINKFFYYVSFWYVSKTSDPKQFEDLIKFAEANDDDEDREADPEEIVKELEGDSEEEQEEEAPSEE